MQVLRTLFFLLVLGNLLLFAWGGGYFGKGPPGEAERLTAQIEPDRLRIVGKGASAPAEPPEAPEACRALSGLESEAAEKLVTWLTARDAQLTVGQRPLEEPRSWWVYIPPLPNAAQAERKAAELSKLGIKDYSIVREGGPNQYAISLGLFKSEEGAKDYLGTLKKKNVKSAQMHVREMAGDRMIVEVRGSAERLKKAWAELPPELATAQTMECTTAARP